MSDLSDLAQRIATLSSHESVEPSGARELLSHGATPLMAILREVDETMLERCLAFQCGGITIHIIAAGRRMRGILSISPQSQSKAIGQVLSREEPDVLQAAHDELQRLVGVADNLTVQSLPAEQPFGKGGERGISAIGLAELWGISLEAEPKAKKPPVEQFLTANAAAISGMLHVLNGKVAASSGNVARVQSVWDTQIDDFLAGHAKIAGRTDTPAFISLGEAFEDGQSIALALYEDHSLLISHDPAKLGVIQASWERIFG